MLGTAGRTAKGCAALPSPCCSHSSFPGLQPRQKAGSFCTSGIITMGAGWGHLIMPTGACKSTAAEVWGLQDPPWPCPSAFPQCHLTLQLPTALSSVPVPGRMVVARAGYRHCQTPSAGGAWRFLSSPCPEQDQPQRVGAAQGLGSFFIPCLQKAAARSFGGGEEGEHSLPSSQWEFAQVGISSWSYWLWAQANKRRCNLITF